MGLTVVGLTAWFAFAHPFGGSSASHASVGSKTGHSLVGSSTEAPTRLTTGVCFNYVDPSAVAVLPCTQPHDSEAYYRYTLSPGPFPGYDAVWEAARNTCNAQLNRYVGPEVRGVFYVTWVLTPGQSEWAAGNRLTVCVLSRIDTGKATGSAHQGHAFGGSSADHSSVGSSTEDPTRLTTGVCFHYVDPSGDVVVPCRQPHDSEAYYRYTFPPGPFPGYDAVWEAARNTCNAQLNRYVGPEAGGVFFAWMLTPDRSEWAAGNRLTVCVLSRIDGGKVTGSAHQAH
jgi:hypothetical protein